MKYLRIVISLLQETGKQYTADRGSMLAAALAYFTLFSLAPLMVISIALAEQFLSDTNVQLLLITEIRVLAGSQVSEFVRTLIEGFGSSSTGLVASLVSLVVMIFGASNVFRQLKRALNTVWGVDIEEETGIVNFFQTNLVSFGLVLLIGLLLVIAIGMNALGGMVNTLLSNHLPGSIRISFFLEYGIPFVITVTLFALLYKILPDIYVSWRDVWLGAVVTTVLMGIVLAGLRFYLNISSFGAAYGAAGSLVVLLFIVYYGAQIFLFGAEFTQVFANRYGSRAKIVESDQWTVDSERS
jgi:membrane protein